MMQHAPSFLLEKKIGICKNHKHKVVKERVFLALCYSNNNSWHGLVKSL